MQARRIKNLLCLICLSVTAVVAGQSQTPSVFERVQRIDDPQLGELIRVVLDNHANTDQKEKLDLIRKVTVSYAQIRLFDQQIGEISRKLGSTPGPADVRYELAMARTELESKLMTELTNLREVMGVVPKFPFDRQAPETLHTWLRLNPIEGGHVYVLDTRKPIIEYWAYSRFESLGLMSQQQVLDLIRKRLKDPNSLPAKLEILWTNNEAEDLRDKTLEVVREMGIAAKTEVSLGKNDFIGSGEAPFFLRQGKITTLYPVPVLRPDDAVMWDFISTGPVALKDLDQHILWRITYIWNLPFTFRIEHDQASSGLAQDIVDRIKTIAERLGVSDLVGVQSVRVEPVPEQAFLGSWTLEGNGEIQALDVQPDGKCALTWSRDARSKRAGTTGSYPWTITTREIIIDPGEDSKANWGWYTYRAYINANGHLAVEKGLIYPQGTFFRSGDPTMTFQKVQ
jgi:hypothetical protein